MKFRSTQFGVRGNTASQRQHASRLAVSSSSSEKERVLPASDRDEEGASAASLVVVAPGRFRNEPPDEAAGEEKRDDSHLLTVQDVAELLQVHVSWVYKHAGRQCPNPLPYVKLGKYLRFRSTDIMTYLRSNSPNSVRFALNSYGHRR